MALKFFNVLKANAEISRLQTELDAANARITELAANEPEALKALQASLDEANTKLAESEKLAEQLKSVTAERDALKASADALKQSVDAEAASKAAAIIASQGAKAPLKAENNESTATAEELHAQMAAIKDPIARNLFYKANKEKIFALRK